MTRRRNRLLAVALGAFLFLGFTFMLTRALTGPGNERARVLELLDAQARGDADAVLGMLPACAAVPACARSTRERVERLARPGEVEILTFRPSVQLALSRQQGSARVAWQVEGSARPVVQCVRVRREGPLQGGGVELLAISGPRPGESGCA